MDYSIEKHTPQQNQNQKQNQNQQDEDDETEQHTMLFDMLPMRQRLDFIESFARKYEWTCVCFGSLLEPQELKEVARALMGGVLRRVERARASLDAYDAEAVYVIYHEIMRASAPGKNATVTVNGKNHTMWLGDLIEREWARESGASTDDDDWLCQSTFDQPEGCTEGSVAPR